MIADRITFLKYKKKLFQEEKITAEKEEFQCRLTIKQLPLTIIYALGSSDVKARNEAARSVFKISFN